MRAGATVRLIIVLLTFLVPLRRAGAESAADYLRQAGQAFKKGAYAKAEEAASKAIAADAKLAEAYDLRGSIRFMRGKFAESVADFDHFLKLRPAAAPGHWRRGISLYYAGKYEAGAKQFGAYEKVDTNDVENAVWHFLCVARKDGVAAARKSLLKIGKDRRVPMMEVYELFGGKLKPADVLAAAEAGEVPAAERKSRLFYAHLYLGLYHDATGEGKKALEHMRQAAGKYHVGHYMAEVARVHKEVLEKGAKGK
jgi:lipoprotein NlpI